MKDLFCGGGRDRGRGLEVHTCINCGYPNTRSSGVPSNSFNGISWHWGSAKHS